METLNPPPSTRNLQPSTLNNPENEGDNLFFRSWSRAYTVVLSELVILILLFYFLSRTFQ